MQITTCDPLIYTMDHPDITVSNFIENVHWFTRGEGLTVKRTIIHVEKSQENDRVVVMAWFRNLNVILLTLYSIGYIWITISFSFFRQH